MGSATVRAGIDTYVDSAHASTNYATSKTLALKSGAQYAYLYFKNPAPLGATVLSATLTLYGRGAWGSGTVEIDVQRTSASWKVSTLNYSNRPATTGTTAKLTQANVVDGTEWDIDVAALLQTISGGAANYGFRISTTSTTSRQLYSLDAASYQPTLTVTWSDAPDAPHSLSPSGGRAVSKASPVLRFDYVDVSGSTTLAAVQVQIDAAGTFSTPAWDSGTVATADPELDLSTTSYAGLALNATTQWRVRVQDSAGLWSAWSDPASFTRKAQGVLTLVNPAPAPNNYVSEATPPIIWSLTGATQTRWRVTIARADTPSKLLWDSGQRSTNDTSVTLPAKVLTDTSATYRVVVYTWDAVNRENTPGDPTNLLAISTFTYRGDATVAVVSNLAAVVDIPARPWVALSWSRATAPDSFTVLRDGHVVAANLDPADLWVSGTSYAYVDKDGAANQAHTWSVAAVVNGKASANNPGATLTVRANAIWLTDTVSDHLCPFLDTGTPTFAMPDIASVYEPIGADAVVRVLQTQRGLEGSISGRVSDYAGSVAATWVSNLLWIKEHPQTELRLTIGKLSLNVIVGDIVIAPMPGVQADDRAVSFNFWSLDGVG